MLSNTTMERQEIKRMSDQTKETDINWRIKLQKCTWAGHLKSRTHKTGGMETKKRLETINRSHHEMETRV